ncbi:ATG27 [Sanghuangporus weigelae]
MLASRSASRRTFISSVLFLLSSYLSQQTLPVSAQQNPFDCHVSFDNGTNFDLASLSGEHAVTRTRDTPPSKMTDEVRFDLCNDLGRKEGVAEEDQCEQGTRACMTMTNQKGSQDDRVIAVIPLAVSSSLQPETTILTSPNKGLNLIFHGSGYPKTNPISQFFNLTIYCDTQLQDPTFVQYNGEQLKVEWRAPAGCEFQGDNDNGDGDKEGESGGGGKKDEEVGSGVGWFFLLLLLAFVAYFILGAYYNYSTYGATGSDLIPHRDFWREVPHVLRDIASHLCSALRPSPRNGYIAV